MKLPKKFTEKYPDLLKEVDRIMYVRESIIEEEADKKPVGIVIEHNGFCGWSLCNEKAGDKWDVALGIIKAIGKLKAEKTVKQWCDRVSEKITKIIWHGGWRGKDYLDKLMFLKGTLRIILKNKENKG